VRVILKNRSTLGSVFGFCAVAISAALQIPAANAQGAGATNVAAAKPQKPTPQAKIKEPVTAAGCKSALSPGKPYFVEFRSRGAVSYGHTFVFYGRLGSGNKFGNFKVAGLHPAGEDASTYMQGHLIPVPAETGVSYGDLDEQYLTGRHCVTLSEAEYNKVAAYIKQLQAQHTTWHASTYNCNSFAADIAKFIGLDTPNPNLYLPDVFIKRLGELNSKKKDAATAMLPTFGAQLRKQ
jgi:hypothetical protein